MKVVSVVGARPQFIKAAVVSRAIKARGADAIAEVLVHTGQHHDHQMSDVFFTELGMDAPSYNLGIAGGGHGAMTGRMLEAIESVLQTEEPDWVLVYGDTNSTLAATLAASKLHIPVAHVEAGLRSFNMRMPEEINRIVADRLSSLLFCPTEVSVQNLEREGIVANVHLVGDVMFDAALHYAEVASARSDVMARLALEPQQYVLATCHRAENTDDRDKLAGILLALSQVALTRRVVLPLHPRTTARIEMFGLGGLLRGIAVCDPVSYLDMVVLERNARVIVTDSGGVQKEAFFYKVPCVTTRGETEWVETVDSGWNVLAGTETTRIVQAVHACDTRPVFDVRPYGDGRASEIIVNRLMGSL